MGSNAQAFKNAFLTAAQTLFTGTDVMVVRNRFAFQAFQDAIVVGEITSQQEPATVSATRRTREETLTLNIIIYGFRAGGEDAEGLAEAAAYSMLGQLEEYVRVTANTLGGVVRECFLTESASGSATDDKVLAQGRMTVIAATFTAHARITS
jgi:hypothetical protein